MSQNKEKAATQLVPDAASRVGGGPTAPRANRARGYAVAALSAVVLFGLVAWLALRFPKELLCVDSGSATAGALVVLGGDTNGRPRQAAILFNQGCAPRIIVCGGDVYRQVLLQAAVPDTAIQLETESRNTKENAAFSVTLLREAGVTNAIIVTSWYHSRRALNCFRKVAPDIEFYSRPSYEGLLDRSEWSRNGIGVHIRDEYIKLLGYWVRYGIAPF